MLYVVWDPPNILSLLVSYLGICEMYHIYVWATPAFPTSNSSECGNIFVELLFLLRFIIRSLFVLHFLRFVLPPIHHQAMFQ
jgi:hypothetical protein